MDEKKKLIQLLTEGHEAYYKHFNPYTGYAEALADHLLANGVVVSAPESLRPKGEVGI